MGTPWKLVQRPMGLEDRLLWESPFPHQLLSHLTRLVVLTDLLRRPQEGGSRAPRRLCWPAGMGDLPEGPTF